MNFFECIPAALHLPHMNFDGVYDAKMICGTTPFFFRDGGRSGLLPRRCRWRTISAINASSLTVKAFLDMQDDNLPKLVVRRLYPLCKASPTNSSNGLLRQSEEQISMVILRPGAISASV